MVLTFALLTAFPSYARVERDTLNEKSFQYLEALFHKSKGDKLKSATYGNAWVRKARAEKEWMQAVSAYRAVMYIAEKELLLYYSDSLLDAAQRSCDKLLIGSAYLTKGIVHYDRKEHVEALDNYLQADEYISQTNDQYALFKVKYAIGQTKAYLGFYHEAIALFKDCIEYYKEENDRAYLNSLHSLGLCYNRTGGYDLCSATNDIGLAAGIEFEISDMKPYFIHSEGINQFSKHNYSLAISKLKSVTPLLEEKHDFANLAVANFYTGKSYWSLNQKDIAIDYFKKVDAAFELDEYMRPDLRESYEMLINYYKLNHNPRLQLEYVDKLLVVDSVLHNNYKYLSQKIFKQYDTKELVYEKRRLEESMKSRTAAGVTAIVVLSGAVLALLLKHKKTRREYRKKFEELMNPKVDYNIKIIGADKDLLADLNPEVVQSILQKLEKFESRKKYLERDLTLVRMATMLETNTKYLSKIISHYRCKRFIDYISDLKVDYVVELLKAENRYRNYTNKALGDEAGFGSTQNFSKAFKTRTGISPTYFIAELRKGPTEVPTYTELA